MYAKSLASFTLLICCLNAVCFGKSNRDAIDADGSLIGATVVGETVLNIVKLNLPDFSVDVVLPNATEVPIFNALLVNLDIANWFIKRIVVPCRLEPLKFLITEISSELPIIFGSIKCNSEEHRYHFNFSCYFLPR